MTASGRRLCVSALAVAGFFVPTTARAQTPVPSPSPGPSTSPTGAATSAPTTAAPSDLAEIEKSLAADAAAATAATQASHDSTAPAAAGHGAISFNPDISFILDVAAAAFSEDEPRQDGGHDPARNGFSLQQLELAVGKAVDPYFRFDAAIVFSPFGVEIEEAFATAVALPGSLQIRAGQFLTRFGRHNPTHLHAWEFLDQPFVWSRVFGGEGNRGAGLELSYLTPLPWYVELLASATDAAGEATARSFWGARDLGVSRPQDLQYTLGLRQFFPFSDDLSLLLGLSSAFGPNPTGHHNRSEIHGGDLYLKYRPVAATNHLTVALQAEALWRRRQIPGDALSDGGGYAQLLFRFAQRWSLAGRYEYGTPVWNRAGAVAIDYLDPLWNGHRQRAALALTFSPTEFSRLRLQASRDSTSAAQPTIWAGILALEILAGHHGAHPF
ncbi:MAG TPA: zinc-regulated TonB-dependent outer membrane receptor [Polyangia bacterium]